MKHTKNYGWGLLSLLAALSLAPLSASARDTDASARKEPGASAPVARTKPVIDHARPHKQVARHAHDAHQRTHHAGHARH